MPDPVCCVMRVGGVEEGAKEKGIEGTKGERGGGGKYQKWVKRVCGHFFDFLSCFHCKL